jgi:hypothetical protein
MQNVCSLQKSSMTCEFFELLQWSKFGVLEIFSKLRQWLKEQGDCVFLWDLVMVRRRKKRL